MLVRTYKFDREEGRPTRLDNEGRSPDLLLCFGASSMLGDPTPFLELSTAFPHAIFMGCSTAGEILAQEVYDDSLVVAAVEFDSTDVRQAISPVSASTSYETGASLARDLQGHDGLRAMFVLTDGLDINGSQLTSGISSVLDGNVPVTGGLAADGDRFETTWVLVDGKPVSGHATAVGFYGQSIRVGHGSKGGWTMFGPERIVTRSDGNVLYELDGKPALRLYKEYLGELAGDLPASGLLFPLALREPAGDKELVRTILAVDEESESLTFAGEIPQGHRAKLMQASFERLLDGAEGAAEYALEKSSPHAELSIAISCVGRRLVLGERSEDELEATLHVLPETVQQVGFYSYGEISPFLEGSCDLHNQTMTLTTIGED